MTLPEKRIDEFIALWERAFGVRIERDEARARARELVELYEILVEYAALPAGKNPEDGDQRTGFEPRP
jgi:hypothetical protein